MLSTLTLVVTCLSAVAPLAYGKVTVSTTAGQTMKGIGASGAWWPIDIYKYPDSVRTQVAEMLFSPSNLGLTSYRYNVGGGGVFVGNPSRAPQTFYVSSGVYDWSKDAPGQWFLRQAAQYNVPILTAFVNSAPPAFTSNNRSCGGHIVDSMIPAYAKYLADVIAHFRSEGVTFTHVSPMNEPDDSFNDGLTNVECKQEGMIVTPSQRASVVNALRSALDKAGLSSVGVIADESSMASNFDREAATWIPSAAASLGAVAHHQYGFSSDATVSAMGAKARSLSHKETWFTELCCFHATHSGSLNDPAAPQTYGAGYQPDMVGALIVGNLLHQSFTVAGDVHFDWWTALSNAIGCSPKNDAACVNSYHAGGYNDGLLYYDGSFASNGNHAIYTVKRFHLLRHFTQYARVGAVRHDVGGLPAGVKGLAFRDSKGSSLILMNMGNGTASVDISGVGLGSLLGAKQTTNQADWASLSGLGGVVSLPGLSITTFYY